MELAYKEELFFSLSASLTREEAVAETERIANNFKKIYSPKIGACPKGKWVAVEMKWENEKNKKRYNDIK